MIDRSKKRIFELDALRGIAVLAMILDHFLYLGEESISMFPYIFSNFDTINSSWLNSFINFCIDFQNSFLREAGHYVFVTVFLLIAGISSSFSKNNFKRALKVLIGALIISIAMVIISLVTKEDYHIIFGILHLIGTSILLFAITQKLFPNKWLYLAIGIVLVIWGFLIKWWDVPFVYTKDLNFESVLSSILGYTTTGSDHFGIIPCTGAFFIGAFLGETLYLKRTTLLPKLDKNWHKPFTYIGQHALIIYLLHQVVAIIIIALLYLIAGYRF